MNTTEKHIKTVMSLLQSDCKKKGIVIHDYIPKGYNKHRYWTLALRKENETTLLCDCTITGSSNFLQAVYVMRNLINKL